MSLRLLGDLRRSPAVWALLTLNVLIELVLIAADYGFLGTPLWRSMAYQFGGFRSELLWHWRSDSTAQPILMFATYSFLHADGGHLLGNMIVLMLLGPQLCARFGQRRFVAIYGAAAIGAAAMYGVVSDSPVPMVGASGAVFGLAGALLRGHWDEHRSLRGLIGAILVLVGLNVATWLLSSGHLAWEAHLGGFLSGALLARHLRRRRRTHLRQRDMP